MWLLIEEWCLDLGEAYDSEYELFRDYTKAKERFLVKMNDANIDGKEWKLDRENKDKDFYEIWLDGDYINNHIRVELRKVDIE